MTSWRTEADAQAVADSACRMIGQAARSAIEDHGSFSLVLAGGTTPLDTYRRLAASDQQWKKWTLYYGDERCLPAGHPDLNSSMVVATGLTDHVPRHRPIPTDLGAKEAAADYRGQIKSALPFDMVVLGMGEDGHTASLFPGQDWPDEPVFAVRQAPKPPSERVTLGVGTLQNCAGLLVLVAGDGKAAAVRRWRAGADLPVSRVSDVDHATVLVERRCMDFATDQAGTI